MINEKRLVEQFMELLRIESPSRREGKIMHYLRGVLEGLNIEVFEDDAAASTGGDCGNLLGKMAGKGNEAPPILLNAHMDTVRPGENIEPIIEGGIVRSAGDTILGADDKSGIAIMLELVKVLKENDISHAPLELLFTASEEIGLLGAKHFDVSRLESRFGYSLDSSQTGGLVFAAPAAKHIKVIFSGKEAHAGLAPEEGVSAIELASRAIAAMPLGRIDDETTANIGLIGGGSATNIVPGIAHIEGEARSHNPEKLKKQIEAMVDSCKNAVNEKAGSGASLDVEIHADFPSMRLSDTSRAVTLAKSSAESLGAPLSMVVAGGGSDANIFNEKGLDLAILGTGMSKVHTNEEEIKIEDMLSCARLVLEIIQENSRREP
ncbi:MAG: M20/M25/M40 family metallo-hydrolase [Proteobacteria bacterium]|nr:M20/M25/M40 family metallo-hydrolase [Pseudomonadota bacterium]